MLWAFLDIKNTKILLQPVERYYVAAALLTNFHACVYGNNICDHFQLHPPTLTEYLRQPAFCMSLHVSFTLIACIE